MKLLVLAQTPPPVHGQSVMVRSLLEGLSQRSDIEIHHVNLPLSRNSSDIGKWRLRKLGVLFRSVFQALKLRLQQGPMTLYYVPAPGRRSALYRDWLILGICRPFFDQLVLHWHGIGLGEWLQTKATPLERWLTHLTHGRANLSIVLAEELAEDARALNPRRLAVVPNGIADPGNPSRRDHAKPNRPFEVLFLGLCSRSKGLFDTLEAITRLQASTPGSFRLVVAGGFENDSEQREFHQRAGLLGEIVSYVGFADAQAKQDLFAHADVLCFPTTYPHEGQPLVLIEALAADLPIVTTRWRAIPSMLPRPQVWFAEPNNPESIADALRAARECPREPGVLRQHFLEHFTTDQFLSRITVELLSH